jgi:hypothetical protein
MFGGRGGGGGGGVLTTTVLPLTRAGGGARHEGGFPNPLPRSDHFGGQISYSFVNNTCFMASLCANKTWNDNFATSSFLIHLNQT